jgi:Cyclic nucleotide-binding domain
MGSVSPIQSCSNYRGQERYAFCDVSSGLGERLRKISSTAAYRKNERLFVEGQEARGIFVLCTGRAKLFASSRLGKNIITRISEPGDVIGLNAVVSGRPVRLGRRSANCSPSSGRSDCCNQTDQAWRFSTGSNWRKWSSSNLEPLTCRPIGYGLSGVRG